MLGGQEAKLELAWAEPAEELKLVIRLTNTGLAPIKVDRQLILPIGVRAWDAKGNELRTDSAEDSAVAPRDTDWPERVIELRAGGSIERIVDLANGFRIACHEIATWGRRRPDGSRSEEMKCEVVEPPLRFVNPEHISFVAVQFFVGKVDMEVLGGYGVDTTALYDGHLEAAIKAP